MSPQSNGEEAVRTGTHRPSGSGACGPGRAHRAPVRPNPDTAAAEPGSGRRCRVGADPSQRVRRQPYAGPGPDPALPGRPAPGRGFPGRRHQRPPRRTRHDGLARPARPCPRGPPGHLGGIRPRPARGRRRGARAGAPQARPILRSPVPVRLRDLRLDDTRRARHQRARRLRHPAGADHRPQGRPASTSTTSSRSGTAAQILPGTA